ncbi:MAG: glycosyltransferase family 4 protein [candidate division KSB1 bacterium]|nr:glycosyltransferase family 4 protein [candidate division KSB1 bacterium]
MKIAIVVHGRFHAFDLARALVERGHEVTLFTNYPKWAVVRFGFPKERARSFWPHEVLSRANQWLHQKVRFPYLEAALHRMFGRWAAKELAKEDWDVVHPWSGISEEILRVRLGKVSFLTRGSAHIRVQTRLLEEEEKRVGRVLEKPSTWMMAREEREYELADAITVLSTFAYNTFISEGIAPAKLRLLPLGARLDAFRPAPDAVEARRRRILSGAPLRVLYVGAISYRKGLQDLSAVVRRLGHRGFEFRFVGPQSPEAAPLTVELQGHATFVPKQPQPNLPRTYAWGDVFVFPTVEDGYAQVLAQAAASGLPILATTNCAGPDLIREGQSGWVLPIRCPEAFVERLLWCHEHRAALAAMVERIPAEFQPRDWADVAADFEAICQQALEESSIPHNQVARCQAVLTLGKG